MLISFFSAKKNDEDSRYELKKWLPVFICLILILSSIIMFVSFFSSKENDEKGIIELKKWLTVYICSSTVCFGCTITASRRNKKFTELLGLSLMVPTTVCVILVYFTGMFESDAPTRNIIA